MEAEFMKAEERKSYCQQLFEKYNIVYNDLHIIDNTMIKKIANLFKDKIIGNLLLKL